MPRAGWNQLLEQTVRSLPMTAQIGIEAHVTPGPTVVDTGTATGVQSSTTLQDTTKIWAVNGHGGRLVSIVGGTGVGQTATITSNTANTLTIVTSLPGQQPALGWGITPDGTSVYQITAPSPLTDIRQRRDQWQQLDQPLPGNVELLPDGGVRLKATANNGPVSSGLTAYARARNDPGAVAPFMDPLVPDNVQHFAAWVEWGGSESTQIELTQLLVWLDPIDPTNPAGPKTVSYWQLELYHVEKIYRIPDYGAVDLRPLLVTPMKVDANGQAPGFVAFTFDGPSRPRPKAGATNSLIGDVGFRNGLAHTLVLVTGRQKDGTRAANIGWGYDGAHGSVVSGGGSTLYGAQVKAPRNVVTLTNTVPAIQFIFGTHTPATVSFADATGQVNHLDLGSVPAIAPELIARADVPVGTSVHFEVSDATDWRSVEL